MGSGGQSPCAVSEWRPCSLFARLVLGARAGGRLARIEPGRIRPAVLVVVGHAVLGETDHAVERLWQYDGRGQDK